MTTVREKLEIRAEKERMIVVLTMAEGLNSLLLIPRFSCMVSKSNHHN